jgi:hypothetical protein
MKEGLTVLGLTATGFEMVNGQKLADQEEFKDKQGSIYEYS